MIDRDELFNTYEYEVDYNDSGQKVKTKIISYKLRYFKYYEFRSINNFINKYFPIVTDIYDEKPIDDRTDYMIMSKLYTDDSQEFVPIKPGYMSKIIDDKVAKTKDICNQYLASQSNSLKMLMRTLNSSIKDLRDIIMNHSYYQSI